MKRFAIILVAMALCSLFSQAQRLLTLQECRELAANNNASVAIAGNAAQQAEQTRKEAFTKYFPEVTAQGLAFRSNKHVFQYDVLDLFTIGLLHKGHGGSITALQPVFAGGRIINGNKLAKVGEDAAKLELEDATNTARLTAEQYYWQVVTLKAQKCTLSKMIEMTDSLARQVKAAVDAGVVVSNDFLKVQLALNNLKADSVDLENGIALSRRLLAQYVGLDGEDIDVAEADISQTPPPYPIDIYIEPEQALDGTTDFRLLDAKVKAADLEQRLAVGQNLPTVGIGGGLFYDHIFNQGHSFGAGMISVQVPLSGWWGGSHAIKKSKLAAASARTEKTNLSQMLVLKMRDDWDKLTAAHRKMYIAKESIAEAQENLRITRNYFDAGMNTITDLLEAQALLRAAHDQYTSAFGAFQLSRAQYLESTGRSSEITNS